MQHACWKLSGARLLTWEPRGQSCRSRYQVASLHEREAGVRESACNACATCALQVLLSSERMRGSKEGVHLLPETILLCGLQGVIQASQDS